MALTALTALDAWECVRAGPVACIVQDITAPDAESFSLFRAVRTALRTSKIPFLFLVTQDFKIPKLEGAGPDNVPDSWLALPCSADQFLNQIVKLREKAANYAKARAISMAPELSPPNQPPPPNKNTLSVFSGQLGVLDVTKILSMVEPLHLTGILTVDDGKRSGQVHFVQGSVRHAELNDITGPDALFLLFHMKTGAFRFDQEKTSSNETIAGNTMMLLLDGMRKMDETKALIKTFRETQAGRDSTVPGKP